MVLVEHRESSSHLQQSGRGKILSLALAALFVMFALASCSSQALKEAEDAVGSASLPDVSVPDVSVPDVTLPAVTSPAAQPSDSSAPAGGTGDSSDGSGLTGGQWALIAVVAVGVIALFGAANRRSDSDERARTSFDGGLQELVGSSRWVHDQASLEVMRSSDPKQAASTWTNLRSQMLGLEQNASELEARTKDSHTDESLSNLQQALAALRGALDAYVSTATEAVGGDSSNSSLVDNARQTAMDRRQQLDSAVTNLDNRG